jgi:uncharacterized protein
MILREALIQSLERDLQRSPAVALLGPRQTGKTTLARELASRLQGRVFDLEDPSDAAALQNPMLVLGALRGLVILDEVQRAPDLFPVLRVLLDRPDVPARFLLLGSASPHLVKGVTESLAGRIAFHEMQGFQLEEVGDDAMRILWNRGGFPRSFLAADDQRSFLWRRDFVRTFIEKDFATLGLGATPRSLGRLWTMAAHYHGQILNASELGRSLGETNKTVQKHLDMLAGGFMLRLLPPWFENLGKRLVRSPKLFLRDPGLLHGLLGIADEGALLGHPKLGASWEGFAMEQILARFPHSDPYFWATQGGAELDLFLDLGGKRLGFEFKVDDAPRMTRSLGSACTDLKLDRLYVVTPRGKPYPLTEDVEAIPLGELLRKLDSLYPAGL